MDSILSLFSKPTTLDLFLSADKNIKAIQTPFRLLSEIASHKKRSLKQFNKTEKDAFVITRKLTIAHLIFIYSKETHLKYDYLSEINLQVKSNDEWMNQYVIVPYSRFLKKLAYSEEMYEKIKAIMLAYNPDYRTDYSMQYQKEIESDPDSYLNFDVMFFCINLLTELFKPLHKIANLGRYFLKTHKNIMNNFVQIASLQVVIIYYGFKYILNQFIKNSAKHLQHQEAKLLFKNIIIGPLEDINQEIKLLLLNKYFSTLQHGIRTTLFETDNQPPENQQILAEIMQLKKESTKEFRLKVRKIIEGEIFQANGSFNGDAFEDSIKIVSNSHYLEDEYEDACQSKNSIETAPCLTFKKMKEKMQSTETSQNHSDEENTNGSIS